MAADGIGEAERLRRWRLLLGSAAAGALGAGAGPGGGSGGPGGGPGAGPGGGLRGEDSAVDAALAALYDADESEGNRGSGGAQARGPGGLGASAPRVARWLGDIRKYFPSTVVQVMQRDAIDRLQLRQLLLEPEMLEAVEPDVHLVGTLLSLNRVMPDQARASARAAGRK